MKSPKNRGPSHPDRLIDPRTSPKVEPRFRGDLPHIHKQGCTYFVTFCLDDAVPAHLKRRRRIEEQQNPLGVAERYDPEPGAGSCILRRIEVASVVENAMLHFQGQRYHLSAWCVMPNHVHALVTPIDEYSLSAVLHSWKSFTAHRINRLLERSGKLWEQESFDHLVRNEAAYQRFISYIEQNPVEARLCARPEAWPFSSARFRRDASE